ncbi:hypothetical protein, partial [Halomarina salina]|uniref:hypothetical protein n=1 Tax=Halomarina salina TaxID=1872699 RepID=UPI001FF90095
AAADSDTNRRIGNISGTAGAVPLPSSTFSRSSRYQQSTSQERYKVNNPRLMTDEYFESVFEKFEELAETARAAEQS